MLALSNIDFLGFMGPFHIILIHRAKARNGIISIAQAFLMLERGRFGTLGLPCRPRSGRTAWDSPEVATSLFFTALYRLN